MESPALRTDWIKFIPIIYPLGKKEKLNRPSQILKTPFIDILFKRRSVKNLAICEKSKICDILFYSMKIHCIMNDDTGTITSKRTCPSAGARHPIDILVCSPVELNKRQLSYYNPIDHSLNELIINQHKLNIFIKEVDSILPLNDAYLLWFSIQPEKTGSKYLNPESLYWRDVGCLLYAIQLACTYVGLYSCPIGSLASKEFDMLFSSDKLISGGGILIGNYI